MLSARPVRGRFRTLRSAANAILIAILFAIPWIRVGGHPLVLFDVPARRFHVFGIGLPKTGTHSLAAIFGRYLYKNRGCNACHSLDGSKVVGPSWLGVFGKTEKTSAGEVTVDEAYITESILDPKAKIVEGFPPAMPVPNPPIDEVGIKSLILFIKEQKQ